MVAATMYFEEVATRNMAIGYGIALAGQLQFYGQKTPKQHSKKNISPRNISPQKIRLPKIKKR
jgi:hypothetical protein